MIARTVMLSLALAACSVREPSTPATAGSAQPTAAKAEQEPPGPSAGPSDPQPVAASSDPQPVAGPSEPQPVAGPTRPPRPDEPDSPDRRCARDTDCALVPDDCTMCPPCKATWRSAANTKKVRAIIAERAKIPCPPIGCPQCAPTPVPPGQPRAETGWIGERAVCRVNQCVVE